MTYRDDYDALAARCDALEADLTAERRARSLPILDQIRVATPCTARWEDMIGDERVRHCGQCDKNVYDLSQMTRAEAEQLIVATEGRACVRLWRRADGTILTADCPVGVRRRRRRRGLFAAVGGAVAAVAAFIGLATIRTTRRPPVMGEMVVAPPSPPPSSSPSPR
jgi:hypothetical protein